MVAQVLSDVGLDPEIAEPKRPHEFSGGQCQRISIARALVLEPKVVICDEPVSALDVSVQAQILNLLEDMKVRYGLTLIFIAHDLAVVKNVSDRVAVMYLGKLCEVASPDLLYAQPAHPYTAALLSAIPVPDPSAPAVEPDEARRRASRQMHRTRHVEGGQNRRFHGDEARHRLPGASRAFIILAEREDGKAGPHQRQRTMHHLRRAERLRVQPAGFLELQRHFRRRAEAEAAADHVEAARLLECLQRGPPRTGLGHVEGIGRMRDGRGAKTRRPATNAPRVEARRSTTRCRISSQRRSSPAPRRGARTRRIDEKSGDVSSLMRPTTSAPPAFAVSVRRIRSGERPDWETTTNRESRRSRLLS